MAAITTAAIGVAMAGYQAYQGAENKRKGEKALQDYNRQDLNGPSPYESIAINSTGSNIMREDNQRTSANAIEALRNMGTSGASMVPVVVAQNNRNNQESRSYIDDQLLRRDTLVAQDKTQTRSMTETRENQDLSGIGQQIQTGRQDMWSGIRGLGSTAMYAANNIDWSKEGTGSQADKDLAKISTSGINNNDFYNKYHSAYKYNPLG